MKHLKRTIAFLLVAAFAIVLAGCGLSPQQQVEKATSAIANVKNADFSSKIEMVMEAQGQKVNTTIEITGSYFTDPMKTKMDMKMDMGALGSQTASMFVKTEGDKVTVYADNGGTWAKQEMALNEYSDKMKQTDARANIELFLKNAKNFKAVGNEEVGGVKTTKLEGAISGDSLEKVLKESGALNSLDSMLSSGAVDANAVKSMFKDMGDMKVTFWIDSANYYPVKYDIDMTDLIRKMMTNLMNSLGSGQSSDIKFSSYRMTVGLSNINKATDFTLPEVK